MFRAQQTFGFAVTCLERPREAFDDGGPHRPKGVDTSHHHCADPDVADLAEENGGETRCEVTFRPSIDETVHGREDAEPDHTTQEDERSNPQADDETDREQRDGQISTRIESGAEEIDGAFNGMVNGGRDLHHETVQGPNAEGVQNRDHPITALFTGDQDFAARNTLRVGQGFFDDEQAPEGDGEHGPEPPTQQGDGQGDAPIDVGPEANDKEGRHSEDDTRGQAFSGAGHGLDAVVLEDGHVVEHQPKDDHRHHGGGDAGGNRHPCIEPQVCVCCRHEDAENDAHSDRTNGQLRDGHVGGNEGVLRGAHDTPNRPFTVKASEVVSDHHLHGWTISS